MTWLGTQRVCGGAPSRPADQHDIAKHNNVALSGREGCGHPVRTVPIAASEKPTDGSRAMFVHSAPAIICTYCDAPAARSELDAELAQWERDAAIDRELGEHED